MSQKVDFSSMFVPQEEMLEVATSKKKLRIGIPKEQSECEHRLALNPDGVELLVKNGHQVVIEAGAGMGARYSDKDFSEAGAEIRTDKKEIYQCPIVLKIEPPNQAELQLMGRKQILFSSIPLGSDVDWFYKTLKQKQITAFGFEILKGRSGVYSVVRSMSEIAGSSIIQIAGYYLSSASGGIGKMLGGITGVPPTEVLILGSGTVAEYATRTALGLGASVKVFDFDIERLRRFQNLFQERVYTSLIKPKALEKALQDADVTIGAIKARSKNTPMLISEAMVQNMKRGAVILDVSIDRGGCVETSKPTTVNQPTFTKHGVIHYCVPNIGSTVARTASYALSNIFTPMLMNLSESGGMVAYMGTSQHIRDSLYMYNGKCTNKIIAEAYQLPFVNLNVFFPKY